MHLPQTCERALFERFLKAEAMILRTIRAALKQNLPPDVAAFLRRHEEEEARHLRQFEELLETPSHKKNTLPRVANQWSVLAVQIYGYESLGLEYARLLVRTRPDFSAIAEDEESHVAFFESQVRRILGDGGNPAKEARRAAQALQRSLPDTVDRYLEDESLAPYRDELKRSILDSIDDRFAAVGLL